MKHLTLPRFWRHYYQLPKEIQELADKNFELLKVDPYIRHYTLRRLGKQSSYGLSALVRTIEPWGKKSPRALCGSGLVRTLNMMSYWHNHFTTTFPTHGKGILQ